MPKNHCSYHRLYLVLALLSVSRFLFTPNPCLGTRRTICIADADALLKLNSFGIPLSASGETSFSRPEIRSILYFWEPSSCKFSFSACGGAKPCAKFRPRPRRQRYAAHPLLVPEPNAIRTRFSGASHFLPVWLFLCKAGCVFRFVGLSISKVIVRPYPKRFFF